LGSFLDFLYGELRACPCGAHDARMAGGPSRSADWLRRPTRGPRGRLISGQPPDRQGLGAGGEEVGAIEPHPLSKPVAHRLDLQSAADAEGRREQRPSVRQARARGARPGAFPILDEQVVQSRRGQAGPAIVDADRAISRLQPHPHRGRVVRGDGRECLLDVGPDNRLRPHEMRGIGQDSVPGRFWRPTGLIHGRAFVCYRSDRAGGSWARLAPAAPP